MKRSGFFVAAMPQLFRLEKRFQVGRSQIVICSESDNEADYQKDRDLAELIYKLAGGPTVAEKFGIPHKKPCGCSGT